MKKKKMCLQDEKNIKKKWKVKVREEKGRKLEEGKRRE